MERIIIKHRKGSKANQTEIFTLKDHSEITFGREPSLDVHFDPTDDWVSRKHATIQWDQTGDHFTIIDHNSRNGVFVNRRKIDGKKEIHHGDTIQLGTEGPDFIFELDPPPVIVVPPTRNYPVETLPPTRETQQSSDYVYAARNTDAGVYARTADSSYDGDSDSNNMQGDTADTGVYHRPVGRETVERLIYQNKSESHKNLINVAALLLGLVAIGIGYFIYTNFYLKEQLVTAQQDISTAHQILERTDTEIQGIKSIMSPKEIVERYGQATVFINLGYKLIHQKTGKELYQYVYTTKDNRSLPTYIQLPNGKIQPRLIAQDQRGTNQLINRHVQASGFLVKKEGFILTCRHVVEPWHSEVQLQSGPSLLYPFDPTTKKLSAPKEMSQIKVDDWIPIDTAAIWIDEKSKPADSAEIEGRLDKINIVFAKTKLNLPVFAQVVRISNEHDVALLKVDQPEAIESVELNDNYKTVKAGDTIAVIGYPNLASIIAEPVIITRSKDPKRSNPDLSSIPNPTIATGLIGKILRGTGKVKPTTGELYEYGSPHDSYQLTISSLGAGTSGAPVFDDHGRVIGIFYLYASDQGSAFTYAIPIKYGMDLMNIFPAVPE